MRNYKYVKISIFLIDLFFVVLGLLTLSLPFLITLYAEIMGRSSSLATTVMLTCYPCVPFVAVILYSLRKFLKGVIAEDIFSNTNMKHLKKMVISSAAVSVITFVAGFFYMPFFIVAASFGFMALLVFALRSIGKNAD